MTSVAIETEELLDRALELLEQDGWVQGRFVGPDGSRCLVQALTVARVELGERTGDVRTARAVWWDAYRRLLRTTGASGGMSRWNDVYARDFADVRDAIKRARDEEPLP